MTQLADRLARLTPEQRDRLGRLARTRRAIPILDRTSGRLPMSPAQRGFYFQQNLEPDSPAYNLVTAVRLTGRLDVSALRAALETLVVRHEVLRTVCGPDLDLVLVAPDEAVNLEIVDLTGGEPVLALFAERAARPFRLEEEAPLRVTLARLADDEHALLFVTHHIASDAWSSRLFVREFLAAYTAHATGGRADADPPRVQYADLTAWQSDRLTEEVAGEHLGYWRTRLAGMSPLELPLDRPRPVTRSDRGAEVGFTLPPGLSARLRAVAREAAVTPFVLLLTAFGHVLHRHCATDDVVLGTPVSGRDHPEAERLLGCFVNTLVLRLDYGAAATCRELVRRVADRTMEAYEHRDLPFERLVADLNPDRAAGQVVQVMFNHHAATDPSTTLPGLEVSPLEIGKARAAFDLSCTLVEDEGTLTYPVDLLSEESVTRMAEHFLQTLEALLDDLDAPVTALPGYPARDEALVRPARSAAVAGPPLLDRFEAHAAADPARIAVRCRDEAIDYRGLNERANRLAGHLDVGPGDRVALLFERSIDHVVAMLAVLKAGAAYVPLDPAAPASHLASVVAESSAALLLTHAEARAQVDAAEVAGATPVVVLDEITLAGSAGNPPRRAADDDAMYVVFTSGSTGRPKGVVVEHRNFTTYLGGILDRLALQDGLDFALVSTLAADLGLTSLYGALATGGTVHVLPYEWAVDPERFAAYFRRHPIDVLKLVPSHLQAIRDAGLLADVAPERCLILAGEACPWDLVEAVREVRPECAVWNNYGPTETTVAVLAHRLPPRRTGDSVPLGRPIAGVGVHVVDARLRPVPVGAAGELLVTGASVARGYLSGDGRAFVPDPFCDDPAARAYRTGDRARLTPGGDVEFLGRIDRQAKIRGYRVEPGYIEAVLRGHPAIADVAVAVRPDREGRSRLVAYHVPASAVDAPSPHEYAKATLPPYMVPAAFVELDRLPLTPNGKVDWLALPEPEIRAAAGSAVPPRDERDERIAAVWRDLLGLAEVGIDDDFFALGGDSFSAMRMARMLGGGLRVATIFQHPTIRGLADLAGQDASGVLVRLPGAGAAASVRATVVAVPFGGGNAAAYGDLAKALPPEFPLYAVDPPGHDLADMDAPLEPLDSLAARAAAEVRETVDGPVIVYGHCLGAALALDIAERLQDSGADVAGVVFGGAFPAPRLPGRLFDLWARLVPSDRWRSDRLYRDTLRGIGGLTEDLRPDEEAFILRALRHDSRQAEQFYTERCHDSSRPRTLPALAVVGERDRLTEFHHERHHEWDMLCLNTGLEVIPDAGHFFLKHQADELAAILTRWFERRPAAVAEPAARPEPVAARLRGFALVTFGQLVSMIGTRSLAFGLSVWVYLRTGSATQFSAILVCGLLPSLLTLPYAGAAADRWNRRLVMMAGDWVAIGGTGLCLLLYATGGLEVWHLYIATGLSSVAGSFQQPAYLAATAQLVPKQYLGRTNGITQALVAASQATGPLLGGALVVLGGLGGVLITDLATVVVSLGTLLAVRFPDTLFRMREETIWKEIVGGVRYIARRPGFRAMVVYFLAFNLILGFAVALTPPMVLSFASAGTLSVASMLGAVGGIAGGVAMALWGGFQRRATGMVGFTLLTGAGMVLVGIRPSAALLITGLAAIAASLALLNGHWQTMIQTKVGMELQGRILATNRMIANLTEPLGYFCAGWLADRYFEPAMRPGGGLSGIAGGLLGTGPGRGMALMVVTLGVAQVLLAVAGLRWRTLHHMEDVLPDAIPGQVVTWDRDLLQEEADRLLATR